MSENNVIVKIQENSAEFPQPDGLFETYYKKLEPWINKTTKIYASKSGLSVEDVFSELILGLAAGLKDYPKNSGLQVTQYLIFRMRDQITKLVRETSLPVKVPSYVQKANSLIKEMFLLTRCESGETLLESVKKSECERVKELLNLLHRYADRAGLSLEELVDRAGKLPVGCVDIDFIAPSYVTNADNEKTYNKILINNLLSLVDGVDKQILLLYLDDMTFKEIGEKFNKTPAWAKRRFDKICSNLKRNVK